MNFFINFVLILTFSTVFNSKKIIKLLFIVIHLLFCYIFIYLLFCYIFIYFIIDINKSNEEIIIRIVIGSNK